MAVVWWGQDFELWGIVHCTTLGHAPCLWLWRAGARKLFMCRNDTSAHSDSLVCGVVRVGCFCAWH